MKQDLLTDTEKETYARFVNESKRELKRFRVVVSILSSLVFITISYGIIQWWMSQNVAVDTSLVIGGALFSLYGALLLSLGAVSKPETVALMSMTRYDGNPKLFAQLMKARLSAQVGVYYIVGGVFIQSTTILVF